MRKVFSSLRSRLALAGVLCLPAVAVQAALLTNGAGARLELPADQAAGDAALTNPTGATLEVAQTGDLAVDAAAATGAAVSYLGLLDPVAPATSSSAAQPWLLYE
jgi:hypothetical protein